MLLLALPQWLDSERNTQGYVIPGGLQDDRLRLVVLKASNHLMDRDTGLAVTLDKDWGFH
jgi:hypothetical protein